MILTDATKHLLNTLDTHSPQTLTDLYCQACAQQWPCELVTRAVTVFTLIERIYNNDSGK